MGRDSDGDNGGDQSPAARIAPAPSASYWPPASPCWCCGPS